MLYSNFDSVCKILEFVMYFLQLKRRIHHVDNLVMYRLLANNIGISGSEINY